MSTENVEVFNKYLGNGVATQFSIGFPYLKREFVKVYLYKKDTDEEKVLNSDQFSFVNDATIQYPVLPTDEILKEGDIITIQRETELGSEFEFDNQRRLFPVEVMNADDLAFQQIQELSREIKRAVKVNLTATETPEELLQTVYDKLDSATEIAGDAISAANQAQTAADNATAAVNSAEQTLADVTAYVDSAKVDIDSTVAQAKADVNSAIDEATMDISNIVSDAEGSITNIAVTEANKAIANAAQEATDMATASLNSYVDGTVKPSLQTYVDQAQENANSAATSMEQAALSAAAASNYASNASADADNAAESAGLAANSAAAAKVSEANAKTSETNALIWAEGTDAQVQALGGTKSAKGWAKASTNVNYTNITNCITEIPQDIKLELSNGVLTLKAGSKVYVPNGFESDGVTKKFDVKVIESDKTVARQWTSSGGGIIRINPDNELAPISGERIFSGNTQPTLSGITNIWYDTASNLIKATYDSGSTWTPGGSFPLVWVSWTYTDSVFTITSIDQVFNGFGYIGSTIFALPGVKGLIPNGRNEDGSLNNIEITLDKVKIQNRTDWGSNLRYFWLGSDGKLLSIITSSVTYDAERNKNYNITDNTSIGLICGEVTSVDGRITSIAPKTVFHALDYDDFYNELNNKFKVVSTLPASPDTNTFYYIPV